jgi:hypothetical protein
MAQKVAGLPMVMMMMMMIEQSTADSGQYAA